MYSQDTMQPVKKINCSQSQLPFLPSSLGQIRRPNFLALEQTKKYLCSVPYPKENCNLRYIIYIKKNKTV